MSNPTTVRLSKQEQERVQQLADLYRVSQSSIFSLALSCLWKRAGQRAERFARLREENTTDTAAQAAAKVQESTNESA